MFAKGQTLVIAEAGVNHNGDLRLARQLIEVAAQAQADYCKFQSFQASELVSPNAPRAKYQLDGEDDRQYAMLKKLELSWSDHLDLKSYCDQQGIRFLSTAFGEKSARLLSDLGQRLFKIPSGEITNLPFLELLGSLGSNFILSTGMSTLEEIDRALQALQHGGAQDILLMQCTTQYPTPDEDINLRAMETLRSRFGFPVGLSDHSEGIEISLAAVGMGAACIEKHFTLDRNLPGPDHKASLLPEELSALVRGIRRIEKALGDGTKRVMDSEKDNLSIARKSLHLTQDLPAGHRIGSADLALKRPGDGLSALDIEQVLGRALRTSLKAEHQLRLADLEQR